MPEASALPALQWAALDWLVLALVLASLLLGAWRGLVYEVLSLLAWAAAFFIAQWFAADIAGWLPLGGLSEPVRFAAGFMGLFLATLFACSLVASLAKKLIEAVGLRPVDRVLGAAFGVVRAAVLLLVLGVVAQLTPVGQASWWVESASAPRIAQTLQILRPALPEQFGRMLPA
ncbi:MAG: CvpA family protein [Burkholderiaceae bacterium]|jgi:membrane protein required for colicin V production|nr:CvpA family protein [Burkholderiaceae bacterium]MCO5104685.1 CvpA family protein [Burkholderiaceae bacterium]